MSLYILLMLFGLSLITTGIAIYYPRWISWMFEPRYYCEACAKEIITLQKAKLERTVQEEIMYESRTV